MKAETYWNLFAQMLRIRRIEEAIASRYSEQEMRCPVHLSIGQEASAVAVSNALEKKDLVISAHRSHAHYLAKGGNLISMLGELYGRSIGCAAGKGGSMHLFDLEAGQVAAVPIVGSSIPIGTGVAFGEKLQERDTIVAVYFGDGATEEGAFAESLDFASLHDLRIMFICENNLYSVYTPIEVRQAARRNICSLAKAHGVHAFRGDGNDVLKALKTATDAIEYIKETNSPAFIEYSTFRWLEHCGPNWDDDLGYRKDQELEIWLKKCPIERAKRSLKRDYGIGERDFSSLETEISNEILDAFEIVKAAELPDSKELFTNVYA